jgi:PKHD-type hydroxylase
MDLQNKFYYFAGEIPKDTCEKIIELGKSVELLDAHTHGHSKTDKPKNAIPAYTKTPKKIKKEGKQDNYYVRDSKISWLNQQWIFDLICPYIYCANKNAGWNFDIDWHEDFQFTTYQNTGFYGWHSDGGSDWNGVYKKYVHGFTEATEFKNGQLPVGYTHTHKFIGKVRKLSLTLNLTDPNDYKGGDLLFDFGSKDADSQTNEEIKIARKQGTLIIFPSFIRHCISPVTKGTRYSLVNWTLGRPFR